MTTTPYLHGSSVEERDRLARMNALINADCLAALRLEDERRVLDLGSGLGQMTLALAGALRASPGEERPLVVGVEADPAQIAGARAAAAGEPAGRHVEFRSGRAEDPPLADAEQGSFDLAHARFLLEHHQTPVEVVRAMVRAVRPGGRIVLLDDDHDVLRLAPEAPRVSALWAAYARLYERNGYDPFVGRRLVSLLHAAGARPARTDLVFYGSCTGDERFEGLVDNLLHVLLGVRAAMLAAGLATAEEYDAAWAEAARWRSLPDAALWYVIHLAEGHRPGRV